MTTYRARMFQLTVCLLLTIAAGRAAAADEAQERKFLRFVDDNDGGGRLETAIVTYKNADGVTLHLIGAVHVGEAKYYQGLAKTFATYDVLLYELIKPRNAGAPAQGARSRSMISMFQRLLKDALELEFQLDEIDYAARNFVNADLDAETFERMQAQRGENLFTLMLRQILSEMSKPQQTPEISFTELMVALTAPDRARHLKLMLGRQFEDIEAQVAGLESGEGTVLLTERNKAAILALKKSIDDGKKNIGLFYGAAHLKDLEQRAMAMGFKPVKAEWRVAWDMTPKEGDLVLKVVKKAPTTQPN